jgi:hypothetical protein
VAGPDAAGADAPGEAVAGLDPAGDAVAGGLVGTVPQAARATAARMVTAIRERQGWVINGMRSSYGVAGVRPRL